MSQENMPIPSSLNHKAFWAIILRRMPAGRPILVVGSVLGVLLEVPVIYSLFQGESVP
jgi:hypothetical protein